MTRKPTGLPPGRASVAANARGEIPMPEPVQKALATRADDDQSCDRCKQDCTKVGQAVSVREDAEGNIIGTLRWCKRCMDLMTILPPGQRKRVDVRDLNGRKRNRLLNSILRSAVNSGAKEVAGETLDEDEPVPIAEFNAVAEVRIDRAIREHLRPLQRAIEVVEEYEATLNGETF